MASVARADNFGEDWSDNEEKTHEIVLSDTEITENDENIRTESTTKRSGPVWVITEGSASAQKEPESKTKYRAPKLSDKVAPTKDEFNFPAFGETVTEKSQKKPAEEKPEKTQSTNRYEKLEIEEEGVKNEEKAGKRPGKKGKKKKSDWKKLETDVKILLTTEKNTVEADLPKDVPKFSQKTSSQGESRSFNIKPSGAGFRNYDNKQETGGKMGGNKAETGFRNSDNKFGVGFGMNGSNSSGIERRTDKIAETSGDTKTSNVWRKENNADLEQKKEESTEKSVRKFFNTNKTAKTETSDALKTEVKEPKTDVFGDSVKNEGVKKNPWGRVIS